MRLRAASRSATGCGPLPRPRNFHCKSQNARPTTMLPEAKLDILLARHATLEAELMGQVGAETYVKATRELSELSPVVEAVKAYRAAQTELKDIEALITDPATDNEMRALAEAERPAL